MKCLGLGMLMEHVGGVYAQFDNIFHDLVAVELCSHFSPTEQIWSKMAVNGWNGGGGPIADTLRFANKLMSGIFHGRFAQQLAGL